MTLAEYKNRLIELFRFQLDGSFFETIGTNKQKAKLYSQLLVKKAPENGVVCLMSSWLEEFSQSQSLETAIEFMTERLVDGHVGMQALEVLARGCTHFRYDQTAEPKELCFTPLVDLSPRLVFAETIAQAILGAVNSCPDLERRLEAKLEEDLAQFDQAFRVLEHAKYYSSHQECCRCRRVMHLDDFYRRGESGHLKACKECERKRVKAIKNTPRKKCQRCHRMKPLDKFRKDYRLADQRRNICKKCQSKKNKG